MGDRSKYRKLPDLYIRGDVLPLDGDIVMWLQIMSPFEVEEARRDAQVARARFTLAMREVGSEEYDALRGSYVGRGRERVIQDLVETKYADNFMKASQSLEVDEDWAEKFEILRRSDEITAEDTAEIELLAKINNDWLAEVTRLVDEAQTAERATLERLTDEDLLRSFEEAWLEQRGNQAALAAYSLTEMHYSCRTCDAVKTEDGYDHAECDHSTRVYEARDEIRTLPEELFELIRTALADLVMGQRDARFSPRLGSSSDSSPQPSPEEESTPSTPTVPLATVPGR